MANILSKKLMSEEDIKLNYITPALIDSGWKNKITMETAVKFTDGRINIQGNIVAREKPKKADYILYINSNNPIAIVEAKDNNHTISYGMQQAMNYAKAMDIPFAYSSNGDGFQEHDFLTGVERQLSLDEFPSYDELISRYKSELNNGAGINDAEELVINQPYYTSQNTYAPRYYQRVAVNRTLDAIAKGQDRLLLVMATGTGKTYTAFQIVYRLLKTGLKKKILYLADRNILVDQSIQQDFSPLEKTIHKINFSKDDPSTISSYEVYFSLYQQLSGNDEKDDDETEEDTISKLSALFQPNFFDLVIVDAYGIIGLNSKGSANKGFLKLSPILFSPQMRLMIDLRRKHAQNEDLSAKRSAACNSGSTVSDVVPSRLLQRQSAEHTPDVDLHRSTVRYPKDVSLACAA